jgi:Predicted oxidoreductases (related to aryl-alcohol dehydrogenases)
MGWLIKFGRIKERELIKIINIASQNNISTLDTASSYGDCEQRLGKIGVSNFDLITKISSLPKNIDSSEIDGFIREKVKDSIAHLNIGQLYGLLIHDVCDLTRHTGDIVFKAISDLKREGLTKKIGVSIYDPNDLDLLFSKFDFDIIQGPLNLFDQRLILSGWMEKLYQMNKEVHVRSIFLQGLLLMEPQDRPKYFSKWRDLFKKYDSWLNKNKITKIEASLQFVLSSGQVDKVIIGIDSTDHFQEIINIVKNKYKPIDTGFYSQDQLLVNPQYWKL